MRPTMDNTEGQTLIWRGSNSSLPKSKPGKLSMLKTRFSVFPKTLSEDVSKDSNVEAPSRLRRSQSLRTVTKKSLIGTATTNNEKEAKVKPTKIIREETKRASIKNSKSLVDVRLKKTNADGFAISNCATDLNNAGKMPNKNTTIMHNRMAIFSSNSTKNTSNTPTKETKNFAHKTMDVIRKSVQGKLKGNAGEKKEKKFPHNMKEVSNGVLLNGKPANNIASAKRKNDSDFESKPSKKISSKQKTEKKKVLNDKTVASSRLESTKTNTSKLNNKDSEKNIKNSKKLDSTKNSILNLKNKSNPLNKTNVNCGTNNKRSELFKENIVNITNKNSNTLHQNATPVLQSHHVLFLNNIHETLNNSYKKKQEILNSKNVNLLQEKSPERQKSFDPITRNFCDILSPRFSNSLPFILAVEGLDKIPTTIPQEDLSPVSLTKWHSDTCLSERSLSMSVHMADTRNGSGDEETASMPDVSCDESNNILNNSDTLFGTLFSERTGETPLDLSNDFDLDLSNDIYFYDDEIMFTEHLASDKISYIEQNCNNKLKKTPFNCSSTPDLPMSLPLKEFINYDSVISSPNGCNSCLVDSVVPITKKITSRFPSGIKQKTELQTQDNRAIRGKSEPPTLNTDSRRTSKTTITPVFKPKLRRTTVPNLHRSIEPRGSKEVLNESTFVSDKKLRPKLSVDDSIKRVLPARKSALVKPLSDLEELRNDRATKFPHSPSAKNEDEKRRPGSAVPMRTIKTIPRNTAPSRRKTEPVKILRPAPVVASVPRLSSSEASQQIKKLEAEVSSRTQDAQTAKEEAAKAQRGIEALTVIVRYLTKEYDAFSCPKLKGDVRLLETQLKQIKLCLDESEATTIRLTSDLAESRDLHEKEAKQLREQLVRESDQLRQQHTKQLKREEEIHRLNVEEILQQEELKSKELCERERSSAFDASAFQRDEFEKQRLIEIQEAEETHIQKISDLESRWVKRESETREAEICAEKESSRLRVEAKKLREAMLTEHTTDHRLQAARQMCSGLQKEVESLKSVLEMRTSESHEMRMRLAQLESVDEALSKSRERGRAMRAKMEDLEAQMRRKLHTERQLLCEQQSFSEALHRESTANKRLSLENEELRWKLRQREAAAAASGEDVPLSTLDLVTRADLPSARSENTRKSGSLSPQFSPRIQRPQRLVSSRQWSRSVSETGVDVSNRRLTTRIADTTVAPESPPPSPRVKSVVEKSNSVSFILDLSEPFEDESSRDGQSVDSLSDVDGASEGRSDESRGSSISCEDIDRVSPTGIAWTVPVHPDRHRRPRLLRHADEDEFEEPEGTAEGALEAVVALAGALAACDAEESIEATEMPQCVPLHTQCHVADLSSATVSEDEASTLALCDRPLSSGGEAMMDAAKDAVSSAPSPAVSEISPREESGNSDVKESL